MKIKVSWREKNGELHFKIYDDQASAVKARAWLVKMGATDIDLVIVK